LRFSKEFIPRAVCSAGVYNDAAPVQYHDWISGDVFLF